MLARAHDAWRRAAYLKPGDSPSGDFFISPILAPLQLLARFPPVYIVVGTRDPLYDDSTIVTERCARARRRAPVLSPVRASIEKAKEGRPERPVELDVLDGFSHGFLHMLMLVPEVERVVARTGRWMSAVLSNNAKANWVV